MYLVFKIRLRLGKSRRHTGPLIKIQETLQKKFCKVSFALYTAAFAANKRTDRTVPKDQEFFEAT